MLSFVQKISKGDPEAISQFYTYYSPKIEKYLSKKMPTEVAKEITNDVFLEAIETLSFLKDEHKLKPWLYQIAHHKMVDYYRKRKIRTLVLSKVPYLELVAHEINQPEFQYEKNSIRDGIEKTLIGLSLPHRTILKMHYELDLPVKEVALQMNLSFKATESLLFRARKAFQKAYERE
jgi:RNA polymerase sigma-70 factor (ECF subfamily)